MQRVRREEQGQRQDQGNTTDNPELPSAMKLERSADSPSEKEEVGFKVHLRIEGIAQDIIHEKRIANGTTFKK